MIPLLWQTRLHYIIFFATIVFWQYGPQKGSSAWGQVSQDEMVKPQSGRDVSK